uniref:Putative secreted protein n=1 Tax=Anopheles darlingi TaxID=43151 RepID=A0A2M4DFF9_ANODA
MWSTMWRMHMHLFSFQLLQHGSRGSRKPQSTGVTKSILISLLDYCYLKHSNLIVKIDVFRYQFLMHDKIRRYLC